MQELLGVFRRIWRRLIGDEPRDLPPSLMPSPSLPMPYIPQRPFPEIQMPLPTGTVPQILLSGRSSVLRNDGMILPVIPRLLLPEMPLPSMAFPPSIIYQPHIAPPFASAFLPLAPSEVSSAHTPVRTKSRTYFGLDEEVFNAIKWGVAYNFVRDCIWGYLSVNQQGFGLKKTSNIHDQVYAQFVYSSLAMVSLLGAKYLMCGPSGKYKSDFAAIAGSSLGIISWDWAQIAAINSLKAQGYSDVTANFLACFATGPAEGTTVWSVSSCVARSLEISSKTYEVIRKDEPWHFSIFFGFNSLQGFIHLIQRLLRGLFMSCTVGALGGAVWQVVFEGLVLGRVEPLLSGLIIALSVAVCNFFGGVFSNWTRKLLIDYQEKIRQEDATEMAPRGLPLTTMWQSAATAMTAEESDDCARVYIPTFVGV